MRAIPSDDRSKVWRSRSTLALIVHAGVVLMPAAVGFAIGRAAFVATPPSEAPVPKLAWIAIVLVVSLAGGVVVERLARRLLPLVALLRLNLVFPDRAPTRFSVALKTGTTRQLQRRIDHAIENGLGETDEAEFGALVLELAAALSIHDRLTRGHGERVRAYTDLIAAEMGLSAADASKLRWASLLHDIGKLWVPREILNSPNVPTTAEWEILKQHPLDGLRLVMPLKNWLGPWALCVGQHHERWDGAGYPFGLSGTDIHIGARIVAVADAYDVMTSTRSYKKPMSSAEARAEIARCAGLQFDPVVARAFLNIGVGPLHRVAGPLGMLANLGSFAAPQILPQGIPGLAGLATLTVASAATFLLIAVDEIHDRQPAAEIASVDDSADHDEYLADGKSTSSDDLDGSGSPLVAGPAAPASGRGLPGSQESTPSTPYTGSVPSDPAASSTVPSVTEPPPRPTVPAGNGPVTITTPPLGDVVSVATGLLSGPLGGVRNVALDEETAVVVALSESGSPAQISVVEGPSLGSLDSDLGAVISGGSSSAGVLGTAASG